MADLKKYTVTVELKCEFTYYTDMTPEEIQFDVASKLEYAIDHKLDGASDLDGPFNCDVKVEAK